MSLRVKTTLPNLGRELRKLARGGGLFGYLVVRTMFYSARDFFLFLPRGAPSPVGDPRRDKHSGLYRGSHRLSVGSRPKYARLGLQATYAIPGAAEALAALAPLKRPQQKVSATNDAGAALPRRRRKSYAGILEKGRHRQTYQKRSGGTGTRMAGSLQAPKGVHKVALAWVGTQKARIAGLAKRDALREAARIYAAAGGGR